MNSILLFLLPFCLSLSGVNINVFNLNVRLDQLVVCILFVQLIAKKIIKGKNIIYDIPSIYLIIFLTISLFSSLFYSPNSTYSAVQTLNIASVSLTYIVLVNYLSVETEFIKSLKYYLITGIIVSIIGITLFVFSKLNISSYGIVLDDSGAFAYGISSTMREQNIFGSYSLIYFVIAFGLIIHPIKNIVSKKIVQALICTSALALFLSFTRGAWLGAIIVCPLMLFFQPDYKTGRNTNFNKYSKNILVIIAIGFIIFSISSVVSPTTLTYKIENMFEVQDGTGLARIIIWDQAWANIKEHLWFGQGTYSFGALNNPVSGEEGVITNAWIGNFVLTALHDTGIIGTILFGGMIFTLLKKGISMSKNITIASYDRALAFSFSSAVISLLIAFFFTTGFSYGYGWYLLGLLGTKISHYKKI